MFKGQQLRILLCGVGYRSKIVDHGQSDTERPVTNQSSAPMHVVSNENVDLL